MLAVPFLLNISAPARIFAQEGPDVVTTDTVTLSPVFLSSGAWSRQKSALLYRDAAGEIANEIPLTQSEEASGAHVVARAITGGTSANGRFAFVFDKTVTWNQAKNKALKKQGFLRVLGTDGRMLWETTEADAPEGQEPLLFSSDGETSLVLLRREKGWTAQIRGYLGAVIMEAGPFGRIEAAALTANGAYAMIRWIVPDQSATHTFLSAAAKTRKDIPTSDLALSRVRIDESGKVFAGKKAVFDFNAAPAEKK